MEQRSTELLLITLAIAGSILLPAIQFARSRFLTMAASSSYLVFFFAMLFTCFSFSILITTLIFAWSKKISLDACAGVVFSLTPALLHLPFNIFHAVLLRKLNPMSKSLFVHGSSFRYIRYGPKCNQDANVLRWDQTFQHACKRNNCAANVYIRTVPPFNSTWKHLCESVMWFRGGRSTRNSSRDSDGEDISLHAPSSSLSLSPRSDSQSLMIRNLSLNTDPNIYQLQGNRTYHTAHTVHLSDIEHGSPAWWWRSVSTSRQLVRNPAVALVPSREQMVRALALVADIIAIGDLVLTYFHSTLRTCLREDPELQRASTSMAAVMCNAILQELRMDGWLPRGGISSCVTEDNYVYPTMSEDENGRTFQAEEYGLLFFFLTVKSRLYAAGRGERKGYFRLSTVDHIETDEEIGTSTQGSDYLYDVRRRSWLHSRVQQIGRPSFSMTTRRIRYEISSSQDVLHCLEKYDAENYDFSELSKELVQIWIHLWCGVKEQPRISQQEQPRIADEDNSSQA